MVCSKSRLFKLAAQLRETSMSCSCDSARAYYLVSTTPGRTKGGRETLGQRPAPGEHQLRRPGEKLSLAKSRSSVPCSCLQILQLDSFLGVGSCFLFLVVLQSRGLCTWGRCLFLSYTSSPAHRNCARILPQCSHTPILVNFNLKNRGTKAPSCLRSHCWPNTPTVAAERKNTTFANTTPMRVLRTLHTSGMTACEGHTEEAATPVSSSPGAAPGPASFSNEVAGALGLSRQWSNQPEEHNLYGGLSPDTACHSPTGLTTDGAPRKLC
ncbi:PREDICTED: uncharacterized protein LOC102028530 [Chinchilla lanigera]|uniref:uncharacterized protein LOC102028530 n=1 Tax=Chinchilla lanigera TaxID=34839 RepID=UPI0006980637|nr:PREDICTED: uncharacterized protein LOC102028530 [Chinchilla lanigera]XP_013358439.1 PREDICTED: uncharacterized protein LOC102028530 [Chinchilla lanigera]